MDSPLASADRCRRLRICVVCTHAPNAKGWGGIVASVKAWLRAWASYGVQMSLISSDASSDGARVCVAELERMAPNLRAFLYSAGISPRWGVGLGFLRRWPLVLRGDCTVIHGTRTLPTVLAGCLCRLARHPYVVVPHGSLDASRDARIAAKRRRLRRLSQGLVLWSVRGARLLVLSGRLERDALLPELRDTPLDFVENFFEFEPGAAPGPPPRRRDYVFLGRLSADKGILAFVRPWSATASAESRLVIIGSGEGAYFDALASAAAADPRIRMTGELSPAAVMEVIAAASVLVLPTGLDDPVTENFGNVVVEAFIQGRPVMVTRGLHWDDYAEHAAVLLFDRSSRSVRQTIARFESLSPAAYEAACDSAAKLAAKFHLSLGAPGALRIVERAIDAVPGPTRDA